MLSDQFVTSWEELVNFDRLRDYRTGRVAEALKESGFDGLLSFKADNVRYISSIRPLIWEAGYQTRNLVIINASRDITLYVASGDYQRVLQNDPWLNDVRPLASMEDAGISHTVVTEQLVPQLRKMKLLGGRLASDATTFYTEDYIRKAVAKHGSTLSSGDYLMLRARAIKSADEVRLMSAAAGIVDGGLALAMDSIAEGRTENAVAGAALRAMYALGTEWMPVNPAVFSGKGPFRRFATDRALRPGDFAVVSLSAMHDGYCAEAARTFTAAKASTAASSYLSAMRRAYDRAVAKLMPGASLAQAARAFSSEAPSKARAFFRVRGAGLSLAELPAWSPGDGRDQGALKENMALVVEAGFESPAMGTCMISDTVCVTPSGPKLLTRFQEGE